jgi:formiminotetrahydrofolate cyclodeaminase
MPERAMDMKEMSVAEFSALTASGAPAPGGGSISALAGAFGAALACMVARLTLGKKGYEDAQDEMRALITKAESIREALLDAVRRDADAFDAFMAAMAMPKTTENERSARSAAMQGALRDAAAVPFETALLASEILPLAEAAVGRGSKNAVTDGLVAAMLSRAAVRGALLNVRINLESIEDSPYVENMRAKCAALEAKVSREEAAVLALAPELF